MEWEGWCQHRRGTVRDLILPTLRGGRIERLGRPPIDAAPGSNRTVRAAGSIDSDQEFWFSPHCVLDTRVAGA